MRNGGANGIPRGMTGGKVSAADIFGVPEDIEIVELTPEEMAAKIEELKAGGAAKVTGETAEDDVGA